MQGDIYRGRPNKRCPHCRQPLSGDTITIEGQEIQGPRGRYRTVGKRWHRECHVEAMQGLEESRRLWDAENAALLKRIEG